MIRSPENFPAGSLPTVTIVMPIRNESDHIKQSLGAILTQDYPKNRMEVIIADGMSTDNTRDIIRTMQTQYANVRLIDNPGKVVSTGLNTAIQQANGDVIMRVDGHAVIQPNYIRRCVEGLMETEVDCVGGAVASAGHGYIGEAIALIMSSPFGVGGSGFRTAPTDAPPRLTDTVPFGAYRRDVFARIGLFNEKMVRHQDYELCYRLRRAGGRILLLPGVRAVYYVRATLAGLWRQYWQYGIWKGRFLRVHPASLKVRHMVPPLFVLAVVISSLLSLIVPWGGWLPGAVLGAYSLFLIAALCSFVIHGKSKYLPLLPVIMACLHFSWGIGVWIGLLSPRQVENIGNKKPHAKAQRRKGEKS